MEVSDAVLWERVGADDAEALGLLFERHAGSIYTYCFRRTGQSTTSEDLLSIIFLEAWRMRDKEIPDGAVLPWLYGVATNVVRNHRRSERRYSDALRRLAPDAPEPDFSEAAQQRLDDEIQMQRALAMLDRLPRRERDVFVLCAWMGLTYRDAAIALRIPVGTVRSRLSRARTRVLGTQSEPTDI